MKKYKHEHDDWSVLVYKTINVATSNPICYYCTVRWYRALRWFFKYHREYPKETIVLKHNRYY